MTKLTVLHGNLELEGMVFYDHVEVFDDAIARGYLEARPFSNIFAGDFMYMHSTAKYHEFKHIDSRLAYRVPVAVSNA